MTLTGWPNARRQLRTRPSELHLRRLRDPLAKVAVPLDERGEPVARHNLTQPLLLCGFRYHHVAQWTTAASR